MSTNGAIGHTPRPVVPDQPGPAPVVLEQALSDHFGGHVCLTSSGRAGLSLLLQQLGLNRYRDVVAMPRMISACVLEAIVPHAFPQDSAIKAQAAAHIVYHQYGIRQGHVPDGIVIEDLCHAFFHADPLWRRGAAVAAVFSLPKFFATSGMAGGVVTRDAALANALRNRRDVSPPRSDADRMRDASIFRDLAAAGPGSLHHLYADRYLDPRAHGADLHGLPDQSAGFAAEALARRARAAELLASWPATLLPDGWAAFLPEDAPFLWPLFGEASELAIIAAQLPAFGISTGIYQIDVNRDAANPCFQPALMLPLHGAAWPSVMTWVADLAQGARKDFHHAHR